MALGARWRRLGLPSKKLVASYVFDWIVIIAIAAIGGGLDYISPYHRPFSPTDLSISYPFEENEIVESWLLAVIALLAPGFITLLICLIWIPGPTATRQTPKSLIWRRKIWEWNTAWMGLCLSCASAFTVTQGMKVLFGKPRPDLLSRCQPDLSPESIERHTVTNYAVRFSPEWVLVDSGICTEPDSDVIDTGFKSFPSGHSSFSWAGLLYLSLFLCAKFAIAIPFLPPRPHSTEPAHTALEPEQTSVLPLFNPKHEASDTSSKWESAHRSSYSDERIIPIRNQAAAPPTWTFIVAIFPICVATWVCTTRYAQFRHFGADIIGGSVIGILSAYVGFRWYHLPIRQGAGWAWGARSRDRAFRIGVGMLNYVGTEGWGPKEKQGDGNEPDHSVDDAERAQSST